MANKYFSKFSSKIKNNLEFSQVISLKFYYNIFISVFNKNYTFLFEQLLSL